MRLSRRELLVAGAGSLVLAACGGGGGSRTAPVSASGLTLANVFEPEQPVGTPLRLPLALADAEGALVDDLPRSLSVRLRADAGPFGQAIVVERHDDGVPRPYFPLETTLARPGRWTIEADADGEKVTTEVTGRYPTELAAIPRIGDPLPSLPTPTTSDPLDIDPICTADPPCPLHEVSLDVALERPGPLALLVATPRFCQTAICGPVDELLVARRDAYPDVTMIHAEVYTDTSAATTTPTVQGLGLTFEPSLFLVGADGRVASRLDYTFDGRELDRALDLLT